MEKLTREFMRSSGNPPEIDLEKRILRNATIATRRLAEDGWIIMPEGIDASDYLKNPIVQARHGGAVKTTRSPVIGRVLSLGRDSDSLFAQELQFADTELGREYAYLCGVNPDKEVYMRAWSVAGDVLERGALGFSAARSALGNLWDENIAELVRAQKTQINVAQRFLMNEFSSVPNGSDHGALTRASAAGIRAASEILTTMDLSAAQQELAAIKRDVTLLRSEAMQGKLERDERLTKLERDIQALRGEGASAAAQRNSEAILAEVRGLRLVLKK